MSRLIFTVTEEMEAALKNLSDERKTPMAVLLREATEEYLARRGIEVKNGVSWGGHGRKSDGVSREAKD